MAGCMALDSRQRGLWTLSQRILSAEDIALAARPALQSAHTMSTTMDTRVTRVFQLLRENIIVLIASFALRPAQKFHFPRQRLNQIFLQSQTSMMTVLDRTKLQCLLGRDFP